MDDFRKKLKQKYKYLVNRIKVFLILVCVTGALILILTSRSGLFPRGIGIMALALLAAVGYFWIWKPYKNLSGQIQMFNEGYLSMEDLDDTDLSISPELEQLIRHIKGIIMSTRTLDLSKRQAQYRALQNQINPHFLYNTLEGIRSEAIIAGLDNLADMTEALAIFFRYTISKVENLVTVEEELENCATYFKIQQYRFGSRIHLRIEQDEEEWEDILRCMIPKLTLQPILENSIIHGVELKLDEGTVTISITRTRTRLLIKVSDDGVGMNRETLEKLNAKLGSKEEEFKNYTQPEKGGVALTNVNNRIHLIFGEEYGMHVYSLENVGTSVELSIPVIYNENELKKKELS